MSRWHCYVKGSNLEYSGLAKNSVSFDALVVKVLVKEKLDLLVFTRIQLDLIAPCLDMSSHVLFQELGSG